MINIFRNPFNGLLLEGLIKSQDLRKSVDILNKKYSNDQHVLDIFPLVEKKSIDISVLLDDINLERSSIANHYNAPLYRNQNLISSIFQDTNNLGYIPIFIYGYKNLNDYENTEYSISKKYSPSNLKNILDDFSIDIVTIIFNKKFDDKKDNPGILYHITNSDYIDKIKSIGLVPKTKSKQASRPSVCFVA